MKAQQTTYKTSKEKFEEIDGVSEMDLQKLPGHIRSIAEMTSGKVNTSTAFSRHVLPMGRGPLPGPTRTVAPVSNQSLNISSQPPNHMSIYLLDYISSWPKRPHLISVP